MRTAQIAILAGFAALAGILAVPQAAMPDFGTITIGILVLAGLVLLGAGLLGVGLLGAGLMSRLRTAAQSARPAEMNPIRARRAFS